MSACTEKISLSRGCEWGNPCFDDVNICNARSYGSHFCNTNTPVYLVPRFKHQPYPVGVNMMPIDVAGSKWGKINNVVMHVHIISCPGGHYQWWNAGREPKMQ